MTFRFDKEDNNGGFSLVESMIAGALALIAALAVSYFIVGSKSTSLKVEGSSECTNRAQVVVQNIKQGDNKLRIDAWLPTRNQSKPVPNSSPSSGLDHLERFNFDVMALNTTNVTWDKTNTWQLISSTTNWVLPLLNQAGFCNPPLGKKIDPPTSTPPAPADYFSGNAYYPVGQPLKDEEVYLGVERFNFSTNTTDCPGAGPTAIIPLGNLNGATVEAQSGLRVTATVRYTDNMGTQQQCLAQTTLKPDADKSPPAWVAPPSDLWPPGENGCGPQYCLSNDFSSNTILGGANPIFCNVIEANMAVAVQEVGVVFACDLEYKNDDFPDAETKGYTNCAFFREPTTNAAGGIVPPAHLGTDGITGIAISVTDLRDGYYTLFVKAFDTAQNESIPIKIKFAVDRTRPNAINISPPGPLISQFGTNAPGVSHYAPTGAGASAVSFGSQLFQCEDGSANWTASASGDLLVAPRGAIWSVAGSSSANCRGSFPNPRPLSTGSYSATATACDDCGVGTGSDTVTWIMDKGPPPTASHSGGPFPHTAPNFSMGVAKPSTPYRYICENVNGSFFDTVGNCNIGGFSVGTNIPCKDEGALGFCTRVYDGCGRVDADSPVKYEIMAALGENCGKVRCITGLICANDDPSDRGVCVNTLACTKDTDCGGPGHNCYNPVWRCGGAPTTDCFNKNPGDPCTLPAPGTCSLVTQGTCHGDDRGPHGTTPNTMCPNLVAACAGFTPPPTATPPPTPTATPTATPSVPPGACPVGPNYFPDFASCDANFESCRPAPYPVPVPNCFRGTCAPYFRAGPFCDPNNYPCGDCLGCGGGICGMLDISIKPGCAGACDCKKYSCPQ